MRILTAEDEKDTAIELSMLLESKLKESERKTLVAELLLILNRFKKGIDEIKELLDRIKEFTGFEAVGICLKHGDDYAYYETSGSPAYFIELERTLCAYENWEILRNQEGNVVLECMCGNIIQGRTDPSLSFFTRGGSFWSNNTTELLASTTEEGRQARTMNRCNFEGYESVALIPLKSADETIGLLQFNDKRTGVFTLDLIEFLEEVGSIIGIVIARREAESAVAESEERYRTLFESSRDALMTLAPPAWRFTSCNTAALEMFGARDEREFISVGLWNVSPDLQPDGKASADKSRDMINAALRDGSSLFEWTHRRLGGEEFPATVLLTRMEIGGETVVQATVRDITEGKAAEEALRKSEERFREFADSLPEVVFEADSLGRFVYMNSNALEAFGYTEEELYSDPLGILDMLSEEYREQGVQRIQKMLSEGVRGSNEYVARRKDGSTFPVIISTLPIIKGEMTVGLRGVLTDITAQKEVEETLQRINEELDGYAHVVSHDLKGPLSAVALTADTLSYVLEDDGGEDDGGFTGEALRMISENTARAMNLIGNLLALAEAGQAPVADQPVDVSEVANSVIKDREALLKDHSVRVSLDGDLGVAAMDPTYAYQLFANLVGNAIKHNDSENPEIHISSLGENGHGRLRYLVRDNGHGIPEQLLETVFTPFVKGPGGGSGIGLAIADKVVRLYGGEIRAYNDDGACFEFSLPAHSSRGA